MKQVEAKFPKTPNNKTAAWLWQAINYIRDRFRITLVKT